MNNPCQLFGEALARANASGAPVHMVKSNGIYTLHGKAGKIEENSCVVAIIFPEGVVGNMPAQSSLQAAKND